MKGGVSAETTVACEMDDAHARWSGEPGRSQSETEASASLPAIGCLLGVHSDSEPAVDRGGVECCFR
jgi:hypothetical protein